MCVHSTSMASVANPETPAIAAAQPVRSAPVDRARRAAGPREARVPRHARRVAGAARQVRERGDARAQRHGEQVRAPEPDDAGKPEAGREGAERTANRLDGIEQCRTSAPARRRAAPADAPSRAGSPPCRHTAQSRRRRRACARAAVTAKPSLPIAREERRRESAGTAAARRSRWRRSPPPWPRARRRCAADCAHRAARRPAARWPAERPRKNTARVVAVDCAVLPKTSASSRTHSSSYISAGKPRKRRRARAGAAARAPSVRTHAPRPTQATFRQGSVHVLEGAAPSAPGLGGGEPRALVLGKPADALPRV